MFWKNKSPANPADSDNAPRKKVIIHYQIVTTNNAVYNSTHEDHYSDSFTERTAAEVLIDCYYHLVDNQVVIPKHSVNRINITKIIKE